MSVDEDEQVQLINRCDKNVNWQGCPSLLIGISDGRYQQFRVRYDIDFFRYFKMNIDITINISIYRVWSIFRLTSLQKIILFGAV